MWIRHVREKRCGFFRAFPMVGGKWLYNGCGLCGGNRPAAAENIDPADGGRSLAADTVQTVSENAEESLGDNGRETDDEFDKPATIKIPGNQTWDPTDPEA